MTLRVQTLEELLREAESAGHQHRVPAWEWRTVARRAARTLAYVKVAMTAAAVATFAFTSPESPEQTDNQIFRAAATKNESLSRIDRALAALFGGTDYDLLDAALALPNVYDPGIIVLDEDLQIIWEEMLENSRTLAVQVAEVTASQKATVFIGSTTRLSDRTAKARGDAAYAAALPSMKHLSAVMVIDRAAFRDKVDQVLEQPSERALVYRAEIMASLAHEWAHVYGWWLAVSTQTPGLSCSDPEPGAPNPLASCVMMAENQFRYELGLPPSYSYGLQWQSFARSYEPHLRAPSLAPEQVRLAYLQAHADVLERSRTGYAKR